MRKLAVALIVLLLLLLAGLLLGPGFVDWNNHKARIAAQLEAVTGHAVTIDGDVTFALLPSPRLAAQDLRIAAPTGATEPDLARIAELTMRVAAAALLQGRIQVEDLTLRDPDILFERLPGGGHSWAPPDAGGAQAVGSSDLAAKTRLDRVRLINGRIRYRDSSGGVWTAERVEAKLSANSLRGPFTIEGTAEVAGIGGYVTLSLGRIGTPRLAPLKATVTLGEPQAGFEIIGSLGGTSGENGEGLALKGRFEATAGDLAQVWRLVAVKAFPGTEETPAAWARASSLAGQFDWSRDSLAVSDLTLKLGESSATGSLAARFGSPARWDMTLRAKRLDLDHIGLRNEAAAGAGARSGANGLAQLTALARALATRDRRVSVNLAVETLVHRGQLVRQVQAAGALEAGRLDLTQVRALLPGGSDVVVTGAAQLDGPAAGFGGQLQAASDNLRALLTWLGADLAAIPPARLRRLSLGAALTVTPGQVTLADMDLRVDATRLAGGIAMARRDRLALGIGLTADRLNLDGYLPAEALEGAGPDSDAGLDIVGLLTLFEAFDANFDLKLARLTAGGRLFEDVSLNGTLRAGDLDFEQARIGNLDGFSAGYQGRVRQPARALSLDGRYDLAAADGARLLRLFTGNGNGGAALGPVGLSGSLAGTPTALSTDSTLLLPGGEAQAIGIIEPLAGRLDLRIEARHDSLAALLAGLGFAAAPSPGDDAFTLDGRLTGSTEGLALSGLEGRIGAALLSGEAAAAFAAPRPRFTLALTTSLLDLDRWTGLMARLGSRGKGAGATRRIAHGAGQATGGGATRSLDGRWSRQRQDFSWMAAFDLGALIEAEVLTWRGVRLERAKLEAELAEAVMRLARLEGDWRGGRLGVAGRLAAGLTGGGGALDADLTVIGTDLDLRSLARDLAGHDEARGRVSIKAALRSTGASEADWISNLAGEGDLHGQARLELGAVQAPAVALPGGLGQVGGGTAGAIAPLTAGAELLQSAFTGQPLALSGSFEIRDGVASIQTLRLDGEGARALTRGWLDLAAWRLGTRSDIHRDGEDEAYLTTELDGPLDRPNVRLKGQPFRQE